MSPSYSRSVLVSAVWATFFVFGFQLAGIGPLIAMLAERTSVSIETVGIMFTVQSSASLIAATIIGSIIERFNIRGVIVFGLLCVTIGIFGIFSSQSLPMLLVSAAICGFGITFMDVGGQLLIISIFGHHSGRPLNALNFCFSLGAVSGPILAARIGIDMLIIGIAILCIIVPTIFFTLPNTLRVDSEDKRNNSASIYRSPILWVFALLITLYVGIELGIGNWTTEYLIDSAAVDRKIAGDITSAYWFSFMLSRLCMTAVGGRITFQRQLLLGIGLSVIGAIGYALSVGNEAGSVISTIIIGFSFGPIYPAVFALVNRTFSGSAGRAAGVIGMAGSIGTMAIVPLQGVILKQNGSAAMAFYVAALTVGMLVSFMFASRRVIAR